MAAPRLPALYRLYAGLTAALAPAIHARDARRLAAQGVAPDRLSERRGGNADPDPSRPPIWIHAVSVGESMAILGLAARLARDGRRVLVTTTSATSAELVAARLPAGCLHRFAPLDTPRATRAFLDGWRPALMVLAESEIWPRQVVAAHARGIPVAMVNARLSPRSLARWRRSGALARAILGRIALALAQDRRTAEGLEAAGMPPGRIAVTGTLKSAAAPLPADRDALLALSDAIGDRPAWVAASTHPGEEEAVLAAHRALAARRPGLLTILAPRHPDRGDAVARMIAAERLASARRSEGELPGPGTEVYLADTLGEMGLWFRLAPVAFVGGSLVERGGHNPIEPLQLGARVVTGPHVENFAEVYAPLLASGAAERIADAAALPAAVARAMDAPGPPDPGAAATGGADMVEDVATRLLALLPQR